MSDEKYATLKIIFEAIITIGAVIAVILSGLAYSQSNTAINIAESAILPDINIQLNFPHNITPNATVVGVTIANDGGSLNNFSAKSKIFYFIELINLTNEKNYSLFIPVENYYQDTQWSQQPTGNLTNFTFQNMNESNIDESNRIEKEFEEYAKNNGYNASFHTMSFFHVTYNDKLSNIHNEDYFVERTFLKHALPPSQYISKNSINLLESNPENTQYENNLFGKWINESPQDTDGFSNSWFNLING